MSDTADEPPRDASGNWPDGDRDASRDDDALRPEDVDDVDAVALLDDASIDAPGVDSPGVDLPGGPAVVSDVDPTRRKMLKSAYLGFSFCVMFVAYSMSEGMLSSLFPFHGPMALAFVYLFFAIGCFSAPLLVAKFGIRVSIPASGALYVLFVASSATGVAPLLYPAAFLLGIGASMIWVAQGGYMSIVAEGGLRGQLNGVFSAVLNLRWIVGPLSTGFLIDREGENYLLRYVLVAIGAGGVLLMCFIPSPSPSGWRPSKPQPILGPVSSLKSVLGAIGERNLRFIITLMVFQGSTITLTTGIMTRLMPFQYIPWHMFCFGVASTTGSLASGRVYDRFGPYPILAFSAVLVTFGFILGYAAVVTSTSLMFFAYSFPAGLVHSMMENLIPSTLIGLYASDPTPYFASYRLLSSLATAVTFFVYPYLPFWACLATCYALLWSGIASFVYMHRRLSSSKTYAPVELTETVVKPTNVEQDSES